MLIVLFLAALMANLYFSTISSDVLRKIYLDYGVLVGLDFGWIQKNYHTISDCGHFLCGLLLSIILFLRIPGRRLQMFLTVLFALGLVEATQNFIATREPSFYDFFNSSVGAVIGAAIIPSRKSVCS